MGNPLANIPTIASLESLPPEILLEIAERHLTLESLIHWTQVSPKLSEVAWQLLSSERYWATILAFDADHSRVGIEPVKTGDRLKHQYKPTETVVDFIRENLNSLAQVSSRGTLRVTKEGYIWRQRRIRCHSSILYQCTTDERAKTSHEPCWETGWCECTGGLETGRTVRPFHETKKDDIYECCSTAFRAW